MNQTTWLARARVDAPPAHQVPARPAVLDVRNLQVELRRGTATPPVVQGVSFQVAAGGTLCLAGESGSGKSLLAYALAGVLPDVARVRSGQVLLQGVDLLTLPAAQRRALSGSRIGMVFQEPMTALNPVLTIGSQIAEVPLIHGRPAAQARELALHMLQQLLIDDPRRVLAAYPHQLSGGMRQRVVIAMALILQPALVIADEPTSALDVTVQAELIERLRTLAREQGTALLLITHDLGVVAEMADEVAIMYAGRIVEQAPVNILFAQPQHPYTQGLLAARPRLHAPGAQRTPLKVIPGHVPLPGQALQGCAFAPRCTHVMPRCGPELPTLAHRAGAAPGQRAACFVHELKALHA